MVGQYLASLGRNLLREAEVALRTAVGLGPDNIAARIGLIEVLTSLERGPEAAEEIRAGLSLRPRDARLVTLAARHRLETNAA
jgi:predicted Zn-dependent protease